MKTNANRSISKKITRAVLPEAVITYLLIGLAGIVNLIIASRLFQQNGSTGGMLLFSLVETAALVLILTVIAVKVGQRFAAAISEPIDKMASAADLIAQGSFNIDVSVPSGSETEELAGALTKIMASVKRLETDSDRLAEKAKEGQLNEAVDFDRYSGIYRKIIENTDGIIKTFKGPFDAAYEFVTEMANGTAEKPLENTYQGYYADFTGNLNRVLESLLIMLGESNRLVQAVQRGDFTVRSDTTKIAGHYAELVEGTNNILEAVSVPLNEATTVLGKVAINDYTVPMQGKYEGVFAELKNSINTVIGTLQRVQELFHKIANGDFSLYDTYKKIGRRCENDHIIPASLLMMQSINEVIDTSSRFAAAATQGNLKARPDFSKFNGAYLQIIEGMVHTLEAVASPIAESSDVLTSLAKGDLTVHMTGEYQGDYNRIKDSLNQTIDSMNTLIGEINTAASQVSVGSGQVSTASQSLAQGATEQASSVEELTSAITEIAAQVKDNADHARKAKDISDKAISNAKRGNEQMKLMLNSMNDINEGSSNISKIIKVIDDIAFQTNILALNAAVEAARAGQAGKGFAVVAEEVRNLAARSASAAKETTSLIEGNISKVEAGTKIANQTASELNEIVSGIQETASFINNIADASDQQAVAISQIDTGIEQVSTIVQTNSATAEESAASSEELSSQADSLRQLVGQFRLDENDQAEPQDHRPKKLSAGHVLASA